MATAAPKPLELPPKSARLFYLLDGKGDVAILDLHRGIFGEEAEPAELSEWRNAQQRLGPPITRLNRRLRGHGLAVVPGQTKGTYCLAAI